MTGGVAEGLVVAGRYRLGQLLGRGGMGLVYRAEQLNLSRQVALKLLNPALGEMAGARARFQREAKVAAALRHRGAVQIYDFGEDEGRLYLAMELLEGQTLRQLIGPERRPVEPLLRALEVTRQVAEVLAAAHTIGLVHRDLKPSNIFLVSDDDGSERTVVADFGLAYIQDRDDAGRLTRDGALAGTPAYVSPEQALGRDLSPATDVYSLGCTLYEMLTGEVPFTDESEVGVLTKHLFSVPAPPSARRAAEALPPALEALTLSLLAKRPDERPTPTQLLSALAAIRRGLGERDRGRSDLPLLRRDERMLPEALEEPPAQATLDAISPPESRPSPRPRLLGVLGPLDEETARGLSANGIEPRQGLESEGVEALWAPGAGLDELSRLCGLDLPVLTDTDLDDLPRLSAALGLGVDEVLPRPVRVEELARRVLRALRRYRGRGRRR